MDYPTTLSLTFIASLVMGLTARVIARFLRAVDRKE